MPRSTSKSKPPVLRVCQPNTRCATPLKMRSQPTKMVTAIPAIGGTMMARMPATIIRTLIKIDGGQEGIRAHALLVANDVGNPVGNPKSLVYFVGAARG